MSDFQQNNKRIAKNTIVLSLRMILTIFVGVYASRVLLQNLGVVDYGIYNVVSGVISALSVLNVSLINGTQRYLNLHLGKQDLEMVNKVFSTSIRIFLLFAVVLLVIAESAGAIVLNTRLDIPAERLTAANWVFQFAVIATLVDVISVPFNSLIIAEERMSTFAYVEIVRSLCMLAFALSLPHIPIDSLVLYGLLVTLLMIGIRIFYSWFCKKNFPEIRYKRVKDNALMKEMAVFSGWSFINVFAYMTYTQGMVILLNIFFGPVVNAAQALANQLQGTLAAFSANFIMAAKPQITKYYAEENMSQMQKLVLMSSKLSYGIMLVVALPFIVRTNQILDLWLTEVPEHTNIFVQLLLIAAIVHSLSAPLITAIHATGNIKNFQIAEGIALFMILPISYVLLKIYSRPELAYIVMIVFFLIAQAVRLIYCNKQLNLSIATYCKEIVLRMSVVTAVAAALSVLVSRTISSSIIGTIVVTMLTCLIAASAFIAFGLAANERKTVFEAIVTKVKRIAK